MLLALFSLLSSLHGYSQYQGHPILSKLEIFESGGKVHMSAMISAGNFCNGIDLERSTDGKNFQVVATEYGSCGNLMEAVTYTLTDAAPPKIKNFITVCTYWDRDIPLKKQSIYWV